eukprot:356923-Chlamydomonas_euryale.AAC.2
MSVDRGKNGRYCVRTSHCSSSPCSSSDSTAVAVAVTARPSRRDAEASLAKGVAIVQADRAHCFLHTCTQLLLDPRTGVPGCLWRHRCGNIRILWQCHDAVGNEQVDPAGVEVLPGQGGGFIWIVDVERLWGMGKSIMHTLRCGASSA